MIVLNVSIDNFYAFKNFNLNLTYPKKIVDSCIQEEHLSNFPNFRYKKVNVIMGANASGKTTLGFMLRAMCNFIFRKNDVILTSAIQDRTQRASFTIDIVKTSILYRVSCVISPKRNGAYEVSDIHVEVRREAIRARDSYESCVKRLEEASYSPSKSYLEELDKVEEMGWLFEFPTDTKRVIQFNTNDKKFPHVLENILKALDPSILRVKPSKDVDGAYVIQLRNESVILQNGSPFDTNRLSSGTKAGVEIAKVVSSLMQGRNSFYYCDEKFSYIHSDIEKAVLSLMIGSIRPNEQLFFTTHNTDILDMDLPKHAFTFLRKDLSNEEQPITCVTASSLLKRSSDSLKNAVENDVFSTSPAVDLIYALEKL